jgi:preprotein translocase subunit Sec63
MRPWYYIGRKVNRKLLWSQRKTFILLIIIALGILVVSILLLKVVQ